MSLLISLSVINHISVCNHFKESLLKLYPKLFGIHSFFLYVFKEFGMIVV